MLILVHHDRDGARVIELTGDLDVYTAPRLRDMAAGLISAGHSRLVIDLERCEFIDAAGLAVIVGTLKRVRACDGSLAIVCTGERIRKIFEITGLTRVLTFCGTVDDALGEQVAADA